MTASDLLTAPPPTHLVYIPFIIFVGIVIGYVIGRKAGLREGEAEAYGGGDEDDLL